jgi:hypothetical protein
MGQQKRNIEDTVVTMLTDAEVTRNDLALQFSVSRMPLAPH